MRLASTTSGKLQANNSTGHRGKFLQFLFHNKKTKKPLQANSINTDTSKSSLIVPIEILVQIIHHCIPKFSITCYPACLGFAVPYTSTPPKARHYRGIPRIMNLQLVNHFFYDEVWKIICLNFWGNLRFSRFMLENGFPVLGQTIEEQMMINEVFSKFPKLEVFRPHVQQIYLGPDIQLLPSINPRRWPSLHTIALDLSRECCGAEWELKTCTMTQVFAGEMDDRIRRVARGYVKKYFRNLNDVGAVLEGLKEDQVKLSFQFDFEVNRERYGQNVVMIWVDATDGADGLIVEKKLNCSPECEELDWVVEMQ